MSTENRGSSAADKVFWTAIFVSVVFCVWTPLAGFLGDRPDRVHDPEVETKPARFAQWLSCIFHVGGSVTTFFVAFSAWGWQGAVLVSVWVLFAALVLSRRICARVGVPLSIDTLERLVKVQTRDFTVFLGAASASIAAIPVGLVLGSTPGGLIAGLASVVVMVAALRIARGYLAWLTANAIAHEVWDTKIHTASGASVAAVNDCGLEETADGGIIIHPVNSDVALAFSDVDRVEATLAKIFPDLEQELPFNPRRIVLRASSPETDAMREAVAASGGQHGGAGVPVAFAAPAPVATAAPVSPAAGAFNIPQIAKHGSTPQQPADATDSFHVDI